MQVLILKTKVDQRVFRRQINKHQDVRLSFPFKDIKITYQQMKELYIYSSVKVDILKHFRETVA